MNNTIKNTYHHGNLKEELVVAGIDILKRKGFDALTIREVARQCGVSHNAPYRHFKDRNELIQTIANDVGEKLRNALEVSIQGIHDDPLSEFLEMGWAYVKFGIDYKEDFRLAFDGRMSNENVPLLKALDLLVSTIQKAQQKGVFRTEPLMDQAITAWSLVHGLATILMEPSMVPSPLLMNTTKEILAKSAIKSIAEGWSVKDKTQPSNIN